MHPASVKAVFEPGKSQKADGLTKVLAGASIKKPLCRTLVWHLSLDDVSYFASNHQLVEELWRGLTNIWVAARILDCSPLNGIVAT